MSSRELARLLRLIATEVERNPESGIRNLIERMSEKTETTKRPNTIRNRVKDPRDDVRLNQLFKTMEEATDRDIAKRILMDQSLMRRDLVDLAAKFQVRISKEDRRDDIVDRIVEATVGSKLNSLAVRGEL